jgi:putative CocE/NonD family hydrolase
VLRDAGREVQLIVGPWTHSAFGMLSAGIRESLAWLRAHMLDDRTHLRPERVRLFVMGANKWRTFEDWPPANVRPRRWHLQAGKGLAPAEPSTSEPDRYRYDPADPTPALGGAILSPPSGKKDQAPLAARADVLCYTGAALDADLEVIGPVAAEIWLRSSLEHTDLFVSLCDVNPKGKAINICDALVRLAPERPPAGADGVRKVVLELLPTAYRFRRGHRVRVQIASGAHPRWARNPGSGEPLATATTLIAADQEIFHDPAHPSAIILPVVS